MLQKLFARLQRDRRCTVGALALSTLLFGGGSYLAQHGIDTRQGALAMLGVLLVLLGLLGQLGALALLFRQR